MAKLENVNRTGFPRNELFRQPYVHRLWGSYKKFYGQANVGGMQSDAFKIYKEQSNRLKTSFAKQNKMELEEADRTIKTLEEALSAMTGMSAFQEAAGSNMFLNEEYKIDGNSFYSYSSSAAKRETLFQEDSNKLAEFIGKLGSAMDSFEGISETSRKYIEAQIREQQVTIPTKEMANAMQNIYSDGKADKGIKKLVAATLLLKNYAGQLPAHLAEGVPKINDADAREIIRGLAGSMNGLKGGFFEIAVNSLLNNAGSDFLKDIKSMHGVEITGAAMQGDTAIKSKSLGGKATTSKTDLKVKGIVNGLEAEFGLSLKTSDLKHGKGNPVRTTIVHTGNLGNLIQRANALMEESTYHLANTAAHKTYNDSVYKAAKSKLAAILAFDALAGLGTKQDTAYFIMYQNKVVSMTSFLDQLSSPGPDGNPSLNMTIQGTGAYATRAKKLRKGANEIERYNRSREAMSIFLGLRVVLTSKTSS